MGRPKGGAQLLVELSALGDGGDAVDLRGDTGAVGRVTALEDERDAVQLDLKGDVFVGEVVPLSGRRTVCVLALGPTDAKIESVFAEFLRVKQTGTVVGAMGGKVVEGNVKMTRGPAMVARGDGSDDEAVVVASSARKSSSKPKPKPKPNASKPKAAPPPISSVASSATTTTTTKKKRKRARKDSDDDEDDDDDSDFEG